MMRSMSSKFHPVQYAEPGDWTLESSSGSPSCLYVACAVESVYWGYLGIQASKRETCYRK